MEKNKTKIYLNYFVKEAQPQNHDHLPKNSSEEYEKVLATVSKRKSQREERSKRTRSRCKVLSKKRDETIGNNDSHNTKDINLLLRAVTNENVDSIEQILSRNEYDINLRDNHVWTPLMCACRRGDVAIVELLLNKGAKVNVKDAAGNTPLSIAKSCNHSGVYELLLRKKSEAEDIERDRETAYNIIQGGNTNEDVSHSVDDSKCRDRLEDSIGVNNSNKISRNSEEIQKNYTEKNELVKLNVVSKLEESSVVSKKGDTPSNTRDNELICISSDTDEEKITTHCSLCNINVVEENYKEHLLSTVHQFYKQLKATEENDGKLTKPVDYSVPEENKGFQLLLKCGWSKQSGLGKCQSGIKVPIKTKIKYDKMGIGKTKQKKNLMHKVLPEYNVKFNTRLKKEIEKSKEILYRKEFNTM